MDKPDPLHDVAKYVSDLELCYQWKSFRLTIAVHDDLWEEPADVQAEVLATFIDRLRKKRRPWTEINAFCALMNLPVPDIDSLDPAYHKARRELVSQT